MKCITAWTYRGALALAMGLALAMTGCIPTSSDSITHKAIRQYHAGELDKAQATMTRALAMTPSDSKCLFYMGRIYQDQGNYEMACYYYQSSLDSDPGNKQVAGYLEEARAQAGKAGPALQFMPHPLPGTSD